jgi:hypothetical protein
LQLVNRAYDLSLSSEAEEKRQLLKLTLQNLRLKGNSVRFELVKPFDKVFACTSRQMRLAPGVGFEPTTKRLTAARSTAELPGSVSSDEKPLLLILRDHLCATASGSLNNNKAVNHYYF